MNWLILGILVIEIIRLVLAIDDRRRIDVINKKALELSEARVKEYENMRRAEIDELKSMARDAGKLSQIIDDLRGGKLQ